MATQPGPEAQGGPATAELPAALELELLKLRALSGTNTNRRASDRWPVELPLEGWLQLAGEPEPPIPVNLVDLSSGGVSVELTADHTVRPGQQGVLITQAHGCGCGQRQVRCCWQRPHPQHQHLQHLGLSFEALPAER
jgi:hypothetical protein